jgi:hypothetical protein
MRGAALLSVRESDFRPAIKSVDLAYMAFTILSSRSTRPFPLP